MLAGPVPARILRVAQFHELVGVLMEIGRQGDVIYLPEMRTQIIAARIVAEALAAMAASPQAEFVAARAAESAGAPIPELTGPLEENLASLARLVAARRGDLVRIEQVKAADPDSEAAADGSTPGTAREAGRADVRGMACHPARQRRRSVSIAALLAIEMIIASGLDDGRAS